MVTVSHNATKGPSNSITVLDARAESSNCTYVDVERGTCKVDENVLSATTEHLLLNINKLPYSGYACNNSSGNVSVNTTVVNGNKAAKINTANDCGTYTRKLTSVRSKHGNGEILELLGKKGDYSTGDHHAVPDKYHKVEAKESTVKP